MILILDPGAGNIYETAKTARRVAVILDLTVQFEFNGVTVLVGPNDSVQQIEAKYERVYRANQNRTVAREQAAMLPPEA